MDIALKGCLNESLGKVIHTLQAYKIGTQDSDRGGDVNIDTKTFADIDEFLCCILAAVDLKL